MKFLVRVGGVIILLIVVALVVVSVSLNSMIKNGVETIGPTITGTDVTLDDVDLSVFSGQGRLEKLVIRNPQGYKTAHAFSLGTVQVNADLGSALTDTVMIEEIFIDAPEITFEGTLSGNNISQIQKNIEKFAASDGSQGGRDGSSEEGDSSQKKIQIRHFILKDAQVHLSTPLLQGETVSIVLPEIHLRDIGKESGGVTLQEVASIVFSAVDGSIVKHVSESGNLAEQGKKLLDKHLGEGTGEAASKVLEGVKGLLGD